MQSFFNAVLVGKLCASITCNGLDQLRREDGSRCDNDALHGFHSSVRHLHSNAKPWLAFFQGGKADFSFALAAHHGIRFPVSGFLTAVH